MKLPFEYDRLPSGEFLGAAAAAIDFDRARVAILPIPLDRTTSYVPGTRNGPHEILLASSHLESWDEETESDVHDLGIVTLPAMECPLPSMDDVVREIRRVAAWKSSAKPSRRPALSHHRPRHPNHASANGVTRIMNAVPAGM